MIMVNFKIVRGEIRHGRCGRNKEKENIDTDLNKMTVDAALVSMEQPVGLSERPKHRNDGGRHAAESVFYRSRNPEEEEDHQHRTPLELSKWLIVGGKRGKRGIGEC